MCLLSFGQVVTNKIQADSLRLYQTGTPGTAELIIENSTKNLQNGFLQNRFNGRTRFAYALDSAYYSSGNLIIRRGPGNITIPIYIPADTVQFNNRLTRIYRKPGTDSVFHCVYTTCTFAYKDTGITTIPTLQSVTTTGNTTTNAVKINGNTNLPGEGLTLSYVSFFSIATITPYSSTLRPGTLLFNTNLFQVNSDSVGTSGGDIAFNPEGNFKVNPGTGYSFKVNDLGDALHLVGADSIQGRFRRLRIGTGLDVSTDGYLNSTGGMSNPMTTTGDIIYSSDGSGTPARLALGASGKYLRSNGTNVEWSDGSSVNLYNSDGYLTTARRIGGNSYLVTWDSTRMLWRDTAVTPTGGLHGHIYQFNSGFDALDYDSLYYANITQNSLSGVDLKFGDRNNGDTSYRLRVGLNGYSFTNVPTGTISTYYGQDAGGKLVKASLSGSGTVNSGTQHRIAIYNTTGTAVSENAAINANSAIISDADGRPTHSTTTATEIGYVNGVTSAIQTQLNNRWSLSGNTGTSGYSTGSFLGTTNNTSLVLKTNSLPQLIIDSIGQIKSPALTSDAVHRIKLKGLTNGAFEGEYFENLAGSESITRGTQGMTSTGSMYRINQSSNNLQLNTRTSIGTTASPSDWLNLAAGTTTVSPISFTSGSLRTTIAAGKMEYNGSPYVSNSALNRLGVGGVLETTSNTVANSTTSVTTLSTYTTKANTLNATNEAIYFEYSGTYDVDNIGSELEISFAGTVICTYTFSTSGGPYPWSLYGSIVRTGSSTATVHVKNTNLAGGCELVKLTGLTFSNTNVLLLTGEDLDGDTNAIVKELARIKWEPAAAN